MSFILVRKSWKYWLTEFNFELNALKLQVIRLAYEMELLIQCCQGWQISIQKMMSSLSLHMSQTLIFREHKGNCRHDEPFGDPISFITDRQRSCGKVILSVVSVCSWGRGVLCDHYPRSMGLHWTGSLPAPTSALPQTWDLRTSLLLPPPTSGIWWTALETYWRPHLLNCPMFPSWK